MGDKLVLRRIAKTFASDGASLPVLLPVDMAVAEGEFVTIVGPSGCGKSTLFNIVAGLLPPDPGGAIEIDDRPVSSPLGRAAYMPQRDLLLPWRTVVDNATLGLEIQKVPAAEARRRARDMLPLFGLDGFGEFYPLALSGGMKQRVALLRTFLFQSDIMLLDEPFGALDALTRSALQEWLSGVCTQYRRTILFITHDVEEAVFLGDRVLVMSPRPGHVKLQAAVPFERPRPADMITAPEFVAIKRRILEAIRDDRQRAVEPAPPRARR